MVETRFLADDAATEALGAELARLTPGGGTWLLLGDLGAGKTTWTRGFLAGRGGDPERVASPTFAVLHRYPATVGNVLHLDLYRTGGEGAWDLGLEEQIGAEDVLVVEWPPRTGPWGDWVATLELAEEGQGRRASWSIP